MVVVVVLEEASVKHCSRIWSGVTDWERVEILYESWNMCISTDWLLRAVIAGRYWTFVRA